MINFAEFSGLWQYIEEWRTCFAAFDQDKSGSIDFNELRTAMRSFRYNLSDDFLRLLIKKYDRTGMSLITNWKRRDILGHFDGLLTALCIPVFECDK